MTTVFENDQAIVEKYSPVTAEETLIKIDGKDSVVGPTTFIRFRITEKSTGKNFYSSVDEKKLDEEEEAHIIKILFKRLEYWKEKEELHDTVRAFMDANGLKWFRAKCLENGEVEVSAPELKDFVASLMGKTWTKSYAVYLADRTEILQPA